MTGKRNSPMRFRRFPDSAPDCFFGVYIRGGLVQNDDGRVFQHGPRDGDTLLLAAGRTYIIIQPLSYMDKGRTISLIISITLPSSQNLHYLPYFPPQNPQLNLKDPLHSPRLPQHPSPASEIYPPSPWRCRLP